ncbi:glycosyltransferase [Dyadobacter chenwenxiniae]|uniref:Glycosyltransferase n=1 Tax=Dyadobacter chenwenxiniae TaxID=2906456 RepID=A0A9X1PK46_9BACT|nr:nucleotide disphospho-sugar-binding domain-containing protein [Dyadobacter chenwenxiniae]MCF0062807.1 glycosyltransferase [Dyadobacter chenwenxiniae]UON85018.1 glycosyltransferase [Dyadobacter chenwenxiniae]
MKKILFANIPFDGHFNPLTGIAMHLKSQGHDVRWYAASAYQDKLARLDIQHYPFKKAVDYNQQNVNEIFPERLAIKGQVQKLKFDMKNYFALRGPEFYQDIRDIDETWSFDLMISDIAFTGIPFVKDKLGKRVISVGVFPLTENSRDLPPAGLGMVPSDTFFGRRKQDILRFVSDNLLFRESKLLFRRLFIEHGMAPANGHLFQICGQKSDLLLQSGTPGFEFKRSDLSANIRFIGALLPYSGSHTETFALTGKLKNYKRVVLVTQGTMEKDPEKILVPTLEAFKDTDVLVIATTGGSGTATLQARFPQPNLVIRDFISFADIMPQCDVYVTNGGYGGVMLGIQNELPLVVAGIHEGKNEINARVGYFKLGLDLKTEYPTAEQIRNSVDKVLTDKQYVEKVKKMAREFSQYRVFDLCDQYIHQLFEHHGNKDQQFSKYI